MIALKNLQINLQDILKSKIHKKDITNHFFSDTITSILELISKMNKYDYSIMSKIILLVEEKSYLFNISMCAKN